MRTRIMVALTLLGKGIDLNEITRELNLHPSEIGREGDLIEKTKIKQKYDFWSFSNGYHESMDLNEEIKLLLNQISPHVKKINEVVSRNNLDVEIECAINVVRDELPAIYLKKDAVRVISDLNASIDIDIV